MRLSPSPRTAPILLLTLLAAAGTAAAQPVSFQRIPHTVDTTEFYAASISTDGQTVGGYFGDDTGIYHGFRWSAADGFFQFPDLCPLVPAVRLFQISGSGNAAVGEMNYCDQDPECPGCGETGSGIWTQTHGTTYIGLLPGGVSDFEGSIALDVSFDGSIVVGFSNTVDPLTGDFTLHAYRWTREGGIQDIGDIPSAQLTRAVAISDDGQTILIDALMGFTDDDGEIIETPNYAFLWREGQPLQPLPIPAGFESLIPTAISADGTTVVGVAATAIGVSPRRAETFRWRADTGTQILGGRPDLNRPNSTPWDISADGSVIVGDLAGANPRIPFIWTQADGFRPVEEVLTAGGADLTGWQIRAVSAVSGDGRTFAGWGFTQHPEYGTVVDSWIAAIGDTPACPADWNGDTLINSNDISAFLATWLADLADGTTNADFNASGGTDSNDISAFLAAWLHALQHGC